MDGEANRIMLVLALGLMSAGIYGLNQAYGNYNIDAVVEDRGNKEITFRRLYSERDTALRVIQFEDAAKSMEYYNMINVGDTLKVARVTKKQLVYKDTYNRFDAPRIRKINGQCPYERSEKLKEFAHRDSLVRQIYASNQKVR